MDIHNPPAMQQNIGFKKKRVIIFVLAAIIIGIVLAVVIPLSVTKTSSSFSSTTVGSTGVSNLP